MSAAVGPIPHNEALSISVVTETFTLLSRNGFRIPESQSRPSTSNDDDEKYKNYTSTRQSSLKLLISEVEALVFCSNANGLLIELKMP
ncbi:hypothetical protein TNIN_444171 [Trichonephila inaurata madagascariensis]|uniref:Uncharacterized protein n=1 Tax=Trichonephila inaurata madagascariensis TaxID=2747483 RepID=A0A8X7C758_9ARAC|nr:hypothetical protein TNIN_444171 [Trichonephila inaurata madagascariensis]